MSAEQRLAAILLAVDAAVPPPTGCLHCICAERGVGLQLQLNVDGEFRRFVIEEGDLALHPAEFAQAVRLLLSEGGARC